jgi:hypothetical protein
MRVSAFICMVNSRIILFLGFLISALSTEAQNNFWTQQYGALSTLTAGAQVAGVRDNSAIYYNPGAMGFIQSSKISLSANLYDLELIKLKNVAGEGLDARSTRVLLYPQFTGGCFELKKTPKLKLFYGLLMRNRTSIRYNVETQMFYDVIKGAPGNEFYKARLEYDYNATETWAGLGLGYKINNMFSAGISVFGSYTNIENRIAVAANADAIQTDTMGHVVPYTATVNELSSFRMDNVNLIFKIGFAAEFNKLKLGLAITLPSARLFGQGNISKSVEGYNLNVYSPDTTSVTFKYPSFVISDAQTAVKTYYKTVPSFALGAEYAIQKFRLSVTAEYFLGVPGYDIIHGTDRAVLRPTTAYGGGVVQDFLVVRTQSKGVVNAALGVSYKINDKFKVLTGFRTDFNNRMRFSPSTNGINLNSLNPSYWHLLHFSAGASYNRGANDITIGVNYAFGIAADRGEAVNFTDPQQELLLRGAPVKDMRTQVNSVSLIIGYTYFFRGSPRSSEPAAKRMIDW